MTMVKALSSLDIARDGVTVEHIAAGKTFDCPADLAVGLKAEKKVEDAGKDAEEDKDAAFVVSDRGPGVIRPAITLGPFERTELDEEQTKELNEIEAAKKLPYRAKPDISPIEHGGLTIDRLLTAGTHAGAVQVEATSVAAQVAKESARSEIERHEPEEKNEDGTPKAADPAKRAAKPDPNRLPLTSEPAKPK